MKLMNRLAKFFRKNKENQSLFSSALDEALLDTLKEMGYGPRKTTKQGNDFVDRKNKLKVTELIHD